MNKHQGPVDEYNPQFLLCRDLRHVWMHANDYKILRNTRGVIITFTRELKCLRCPVHRRDTYNDRMERIRTSYVYPNGYLTAADNRIDGPAARREILRRTLKDIG